MSATATIKGNLGKPGTLRFTNSGKAVYGFSVADTPRRKNDQTGQWEDAGETLWVDVSVWGDEAEQADKLLNEYRGQVTVTGRLGWRSYETKQGERRGQVTLVADSVATHAPKGDRGQSRPQAPQGDPWGAAEPTF